MRKILLSFTVSVILSLSLFAQGTESFTNIPSTSGSSYLERNWTGDNGLTWTATDARTDLTITGASICIRVGAISCAAIPNGIGSLTFKHQQFFAGTGGVLEVRVNGNLIGSVNPTTTLATATFPNINIGGNFTLEIRQTTATLRIGIDDISWTAYTSANNCIQPSSQPTGLNLTTPTSTSVNGSFTASAPAADQYLVVQSTSNSLSALPADGISYSQGQSLGGGTIITSGSGTSFSASGLSQNVLYYYFIFAFNQTSCTGGPDYLTISPLTGSITTPSLPVCATPGAAPTNLSFTATNNSISGNFTASASANGYLVIRSNAPTLSDLPVNGISYTTGQSLGGGTVVSFSAATNFTSTGLSQNTTYYFYVFASFSGSNCTGSPVYNSNPLTGTRQTTNITTNLPANYYNAATGLTCGNLKTALAGIISTGTTVISYDGLYTAYRKTDARWNDNNTAVIVWDMYSDNPNGPEPYTYTHGVKQCGNYSNEGDCYNREHSFPQSWFNEQTPMVSDIFHVYPTDGKVNGMRGSFPFGEVTSSNPQTSLNGSKVGTGTTANFGYSGTVFEPINEYKGDFARTMFYMATRYNSQIAGWQNNGSANAVLNGTQYPSFDDWFIKLMYKWHQQDPVSQKEINRNDSVFLLQGNRNPFIDRPDFVLSIWSCTGLLTATGVNDYLNLPGRAVVLYPNPVYTSTITIQLEKAFTQTSTMQVMDVNGRMVKQQVLPAGQQQAQINVHELKPGVYYLKLSAKSGFVTRTFVVQ